MTLKQKTLAAIIAAEGGYVNDPDDSGGATRYGITEETARACGYGGDMVDLPIEYAESIYADKYWDTVRGDDLAALSEVVAAEVVDTAVNMGARRAGEFLQRSLNIFNKQETLYSDIIVDGTVGSRTVLALQRYLESRSGRVLSKALNCLQGAYYIELAERREKDETFVYGWLRARVEL